MDPADNFDQRSTQAILAPALSILAVILCIPPILWHLSNRNWGASFLVAFVIYDDLVNVLNALIWPMDNVDSWWNGSVFCDIQVKFTVASQVGMPGALLCIFRSLAMVMDVDNTALVPSRAQRLRNKAVEVFFCIGLPVLAMATHFVVQGARYFILAVTGCNASYDESWPTIALSLAWPPAICVAATCYCVLIIIRLVKYTSEFSAILGASRSNLTKQRFIRLFGLSSIMIVIILPLQAYVFFSNFHLMLPLHQYSWEALHGANLERIIKVPTHGSLKFDRWIPIALSGLIFAFFGLGPDAAKMYHSFLNTVGFKQLSSYFSSHGTRSSHEGESNTWFDSLRSKSNGWLPGTRQKSKEKNSTSFPISSHTEKTMSGGRLDGDGPVYAGGVDDGAGDVMNQDPDFITIHSVQPKNDCNV